MKGFSGLMALVVVVVLVLSVQQFFQSYYIRATFNKCEISFGHTSTSSVDKERAKFAVISSFIAGPQSYTGGQNSRIEDSLIDHMLNKACYCDLWGYDFIFNTTWGFDKNTTGRYWLDYGTWHRVPHMLAAMDQGYEWILYADTDFVFQDLTVPIESFLKDWQLHNKSDVHVLVPSDWIPYYTFSAFAVMIRNSLFGRRLLENWMDLAQGLCPNGNFHNGPRNYEWGDSDQPGLWYALTKTHYELMPPQADVTYNITCNKEGLIDTEALMANEMNEYFSKINAVRGSDGSDLDMVPNEQPILWSNTYVDGKSGLGVQQNWGNGHDVNFTYSFALHKKNNLPPKMLRDLQLCREVQGCYAVYDEEGQFQIGCGTTNYND